MNDSPELATTNDPREPNIVIAYDDLALPWKDDDF